MDKRVNIAEIVKSYLTDLRSDLDDYNAAHNEAYLRHSLIFDDVHEHYQLLRYGWQNEKYIHNVSIHIDIIGGKVWIQRNTTEEEIVDVLAENGITSGDVVLGFVSPEMRKLYAYGQG